MATERTEIMIRTEKGNTKINGTGLELLADLTCVVSAVAESMHEAGIPEFIGADIALDLCRLSIEAGYSDDEDMDDVLGREIDKLKSHNEKSDKDEEIDDLIDEIFRKMLS